MADETAILQMIRILPMVEALHGEARVAVNSGMGMNSADYCVSRVNSHINKVLGLTEDDWIGELKISPGEGSSDDQKMQQALIASAELKAYLRQRIGIAGEGGGIHQIANVLNAQREIREED